MIRLNIMDKIIILAPHSKCVDPNVRDCDTRAAQIAERLASKVNAELFLSDELREDFDLNRLESRDRPWRRTLENRILSYYRDPKIRHIWVLEMHSFPRCSWEVDKDEKMIVVSIPEFAPTGNALAHYLDIPIYQGTDKNDIQHSYAPFRDKVTVLLIESCEDENHFSNDELDAKLQKIIDYLQTENNNNTGTPIWVLESTQYKFYIKLLIIIILVLIIYIVFFLTEHLPVLSDKHSLHI